jgi:hypothetical protein
MLMNIAAYIHPERLLVCIWEMDESVPMIHAYKELDPSTDVNFTELGYAQTDVIVHSSDVRLHWFPVGSGADLQELHVFEGAAWFADQGYTALPGATCATIIQTPIPMHASLQARDSVLSRCSQLAPNAAVSVDIDLDIQAALYCTQPRMSPWLIIGRRGAAWQATLISSDHTPVSSSVFTHDFDYSNEAMLSLIHRAMQDRHGVTIDAVMVYGDNVTADQISSLRQTWLGNGVRIARSQPFARIGSLLDAEAEQRLLRRSHVVAPLAGIMLRRAAVQA